MAPIDYSLDVATPFASVMEGYKAGAGIRNDQQQQAAAVAAAEKAAAFEREMQAARAGVQRQGATGDDWSRLILLDPKNREAYQGVWSSRTDEQQQSHASDLLQWGAAIKSGKPEIAIDQMTKRADAMDATSGSPTRESQALRDQAKVLGASDPGFALGQIQALLAANPKGKQYADSLASFGAEQRAVDLAPAALSEANSKASSAATAAKFAESKAVQDLRMGDEQIKKWAADTDIARQNVRIAAMNASIAREGNNLKRQELRLKRDEAITARDDKLRGKFSDYQAGQATLQDALGLLTEIRSDSDTLAATTGASAWRGAIPGTKSRTMAGKIEQLQNTLAASSLDKLKGSMSDNDLKFLKNINSNLDRYQDEAGLSKELQKAENILIRADKQLRNQYGDNVTAKPVPAIPGGEGAAPAPAQNRNVTVDW